MKRVASSEMGGLYSEVGAGDAERLDAMAALYGNNTSMTEIGRFDMNGRTVLDVGCGDSTRLAVMLREAGAKVVPVDMRPEAVAAHRDEGFDQACQSTANCLLVSDGEIDVSHARFTWGWLSEQDRMAALAELLRTGRDQTGIVVIDYDWSAADGPAEFREAVNAMTQVLARQGFEAAFGARLPEVFKRSLYELCGDAALQQLTTERYPTYKGPIGAVKNNIIATVQPIIIQLQKSGDEEVVVNKLAELVAFIDKNPQENVTLPDIVAVTAMINKNTTKLTDAYRKLSVISALRHEVHQPLEDMTGRVKDILGRGRGGLVLTEDLKSLLRKSQSVAYYDAGIVNIEAIGNDGYLVEGNDPRDLVDRSDYYCVIEDDQLRAQVRSIKGAVGDLTSLPTLRWFLTQTGSEARCALDEEGLLDPGAQIIEISGLAKNQLGGTLLDVIEVIVTLTKHSVDSGVNKAVMSFNKEYSEMMRRLFGENNIRLLGGEQFIHGLDNDGVKKERQFVPLATDRSFIPQAIKHVASLRNTLQNRGGSTDFYDRVLEILQAG